MKTIILSSVKIKTNKRGFALIETLAAMFIIVLGALALAATFLTAAAVNNRTEARQQALNQAEQQIDRLLSLPYAEIGLPTESVIFEKTDWLSLCPLPAEECQESVETGGSEEGRIVGVEMPVGYVEANTVPYKYASGGPTAGDNDQTDYKDDPRKPKKVQYGVIIPNTPNDENTKVLNNGNIMYTYIYYPKDPTTETVFSEWKIITVVIKYRDQNSENNKLGTITLSALAFNNPSLGKIPEECTKYSSSPERFLQTNCF